MSRRRKAILLATSVIGLVVGVDIAVSNASVETRDWIKFHLLYRDYLSWKEHGGSKPKKLIEALELDRHRDEMVSGLSYAEICRKFPFLSDGDQYPQGSYKGEYLREVRKRSPEHACCGLKPTMGSTSALLSASLKPTSFS